MGGKSYLGEFEQMVLATILRLDREAYGGAIAKEIERATGRRVSSGGLYITLDRLEEKGFVRSRMGGPGDGRGGRPKRFMTVTRAGLAAVKRSRRALLELWNGLETRLGGS